MRFGRPVCQGSLLPGHSNPRAHWNSISHFRLISELLLFVFCLTMCFAESSCLVFCVVLRYQISLWHVPALPGENYAVSVLLK